MPPLFDKGEVSRSDGGDKAFGNRTDNPSVSHTAASSLCTREPWLGVRLVLPSFAQGSQIERASPYGKGWCRAKRDGGDKKFGNREGESGKECPLVRKNF